jgi:hypothetical protein
MCIAEIEAAISKLQLPEYEALLKWMEDDYHRRWDEQIESDLAAGKLDRVLAEVDAEIAAGLAKPL